MERKRSDAAGKYFAAVPASSARRIPEAVRRGAGTRGKPQRHRDLINLLGEPTLSQFAEYVGISQPNATYKVNALAGKGYVEKVVSKPDRREIRLRTGKKFAQYFDEDRPAICAAAERVRAQFSESEIDTARRVLDAMLDAMQEGRKGDNV